VNRTGRIVLGAVMAVLVVLAVVVLVSGGSGGGEDGNGPDGTAGGTGADTTGPPSTVIGTTLTFRSDDFPFTFQYPDEFVPREVTGVQQSAGNPGTAAREAIALDEDNGIILSRYALQVAVSDENVAAVHQELDGVVGQLVGTQVTGRRTTIDRFIAFEYLDLAVEPPPAGSSDIIFLFDGLTQYQMNCQSTPQRRAQVDDACRLAIDTLQPT
jgi:hypothetical protein